MKKLKKLISKFDRETLKKMSKYYYFILLILPLISALKLNKFEQDDLPNGGKLWAVLVAGSQGYFNYRVSYCCLPKNIVIHSFHIFSIKPMFVTPTKS